MRPTQGNEADAITEIFFNTAPPYENKTDILET